LGEGVLLELRRVLAAVFDAEIIAVPGISLSPSDDRTRRQYHSTPILRQLVRVKPHDAERLLGVTDVDLYVPELNFVFGEADSDRGVAVFSLARLRTHAADQRSQALFLKRAATEAVHELGHLRSWPLREPALRDVVLEHAGGNRSREFALCPDHASQLARVRARA
jgi:archaemetzincin